MDRLKGTGRLLAITAAVMVALRVLHAGVPLVVPGARPGPFSFATAGDVRPQMGFTPLVPAYRPVTLGENPPVLSGWFAPEPTVTLTWRGEHTLAMVERMGGTEPDRPPTARPLSGIADSVWWQDGDTVRLVLLRNGIWISMATDLPQRELRRLADTLTTY